MLSFYQDLTKKELIPIKILMFLIYGGQATLYPYFTVHLKALGVSIQQLTIIFAIQPVIALFVAPMIGIMADKIGNFKFLFCFFLTFSAITSNCLLTVPEIIQTTDYGYVDFNFSCHNQEGAYPGVEIVVDQLCRVKNGSNVESLAIIQNCYNTCDPNGTICLNNNDESLCSVDMFFINGTINNRTVIINNFIVSNTSYKYFKCSREELQCESSCVARINGTRDFCSGKMKRDKSSEMKTFGMYLGIRLMVTLGIGIVNGLFDAASMALILKHSADIGYQRLWATAAMCLFAPISGYLIDYYSKGEDRNYKPCFYLYATLYGLATLTAIFIDMSMKVPSQNACRNLKNLLKNSEVCLMLIHVAFLGICWGFLENFLFLFLEKDLGFSSLLLGLTVTIGSGTGLPMSLVSTWVTKKIGYVNVMVLAFFAYTVRYLGYSYATDPYICFIYEMMENFTVTLLTVGTTLYCTHLSSLEMLTTMMTLWNGLHVISGRAFGSLIGGFLMDSIGPRKTFRIFSVGCAILGISYFLINLFYLRKLRKKEIESDLDKEMEVIKEDIMRSRAISVSSVIMNYSTDIAYYPPVNIASIKTICRRHSHIPSKTHNSFRDIETRKRHSKSLSFVPSSSPTPATFPEDTRRHINRRFSVMSYTSQLETVPEELSKSNTVEDFTIMTREEPEGSENPPDLTSKNNIYVINVEENVTTHL
ncbi:uncharacterized protein LOC111622606 isoform X1 [Centruroides sculpturatus]|uniref:uncharacterized protein LOC111622606 isoform X1 n=2 Tax=Centruroides sculpturatus TaxID=218467 RepID=UPI000C6D1E42|nr:uncharacterized protein LOC111622606 isoform X1 [Centruroides sculpturatus]